MTLGQLKISRTVRVGIQARVGVRRTDDEAWSSSQKYMLFTSQKTSSHRSNSAQSHSHKQQGEAEPALPDTLKVTNTERTPPPELPTSQPGTQMLCSGLFKVVPGMEPLNTRTNLGPQGLGLEDIHPETSSQWSKSAGKRHMVQSL